MKKIFNLPEIELITFSSEDIICASTGNFWGDVDEDISEATGPAAPTADNGEGDELPPDWNN